MLNIWYEEPCRTLSEAAGPGALSSSSSFHRDRKFHSLQGADGRVRRQNAEHPHCSAEAVKHSGKAAGRANSILPRCGAGFVQSDSPGRADTGFGMSRLHPQPAVCRTPWSCHPKLPPLASHVPTLTVPWGHGLAPLLTGAVGGHVVVGVLAVVLDGCLVGGQVVPGGEGDKAVLQLRRCFAVRN